MIISDIKREFSESLSVLQGFAGDNKKLQQISEAARMMAACIRNGGKIISCGNGGSHCDAMHFAEELSGRYREDRNALPAIAISDPAFLSCVGNDYGYAAVFSRFLEAMGKADDILLAISTSGESENIIRAVERARALKMRVILLTGNGGGRLKGKGDIEIEVAYSGYADRIQEIHIRIIHSLIFSIEKLLYGKE
jgi:D-sedoheptulose 7-phosphate isomerase